MKLTRERKIYASICGVVAMIFAADQIFGSKSPTDSVAPAASAAVVTPAAQAPVIAVAQASQVSSVAERLRSVAGSEKIGLENMVDAFRVGSAPAVEGSPAATDYKSSHTLTAVMVGSRGSSAIINGKFVRIGETIDGYKLESVADGIAKLSNGANKLELSINKPDNVTASTNN